MIKSGPYSRPMPPKAATVDRDLTHELLDDLPPLSALKERVSMAYVEMIAATAGLTASEWRTDYDGFDVTLSSSHDYDPYDFGPKVDIQMKCTGQKTALRADHVAWSLDRRTWDHLSHPKRSTMAALCVVVVPKLPGHWLTWPEDGLLSHAKGYLLLAQDFPAATENKKQIVHLPHANLLTPPALLEIMETASRWRER